MRLITQEAPMGCAIACAASLVGLSYGQMRAYFNNGKTNDYKSGFCGREIVAALNKVNVKTNLFSIKRWGKKKMRLGTIVFVGPSEKYPAGHYLLKTKRGWMNSWINYPNIHPAKAGFERRLPSKIRWVINKGI